MFATAVEWEYKSSYFLTASEARHPGKLVKFTSFVLILVRVCFIRVVSPDSRDHHRADNEQVSCGRDRANSTDESRQRQLLLEVVE
jgi:hypothetical protein